MVVVDGVAPVLITSALAQGVRAIGKLSSARGGRPADLARELGMPPWKIDRVRQQMRGWTPDGVSAALRAVAEADAGVKGGETTLSTPWRRRSSRSRGRRGPAGVDSRAAAFGRLKRVRAGRGLRSAAFAVRLVEEPSRDRAWQVLP